MLGGFSSSILFNSAGRSLFFAAVILTSLLKVGRRKLLVEEANKTLASTPPRLAENLSVRDLAFRPPENRHPTRTVE